MAIEGIGYEQGRLDTLYLYNEKLLWYIKVVRLLFGGEYTISKHFINILKNNKYIWYLKKSYEKF